MLALVIGGVVTATADTTPVMGRRLDTGDWVTPGPDGWTAETLAACGWLPVTVTDRPADTGTDTTDRTVSVVDGVPVTVWLRRPWTPTEVAARTPPVDMAAVRTAMASATTILDLRAASLKLVDSIEPIV